MKLKKVLALVLCFAMVLSTMSFAVSAEGAVSEWDGTYPESKENNGWINISKVDDYNEENLYINSAKDFAAFAYIVNTWPGASKNPFTNKNVYLNVDIDLKNFPWIPIGPGQPGEKNRFYGSFYGQGHTISNLNVAEGYYYAGLFGKVPTWGYTQVFDGITIENAKVASADETNKNKEGAGALLGGSTGSVISNCHVTGNIEISGDKYVGGLVGDSYAQISDCSVKATGTITATDFGAGGLVGQQCANATQASKVEECEVEGGAEGLAISANRAYVGGLVGYVPAGNGEYTTIDDVKVSSVTVNAQSEDGRGAAYIATGYAATNATVENVTTTVAGEPSLASDVVAKIGNTEYLSFYTAVAEAEDDETVELLKDVTVADWQQLTDKQITIDGNGNTVTITSVTDNTYNNGGSLIRNVGGGTSNSKVLNISDITFVLPEVPAGEYRGVVVAQTIAGTMTDVTVNNGRYGFMVDGATHFYDCTFNGQNSEAIYFKDVDGAPGSVVDGCTFNLENARVGALWSSEVFTNNVINYDGSAITGLTILSNSSATVSGNVFAEDTKLEVYVNGDAQGSFTLSKNEINGSVFTDGSAISTQFDNVTIESNTLSDAALAGLQTIKNDVVSVDSVAKIGSVPYYSLQEAIAAIGSAEGEYEIQVIADITENVTVTQYKNQKITIVGAKSNARSTADKPVISGTIIVNGRSNLEENEALTLKNLAFNADAAINGAVVLIPSGDYRYAMNITIDGCDVVGTTENTFNNITFIRETTGGGKNFVVKNTTVTGIHSLMQAKNITGLEIDKCAIIDCNEGINLNNTPAATIKNTTADVTGYAVRIGQTKNGPGTPLGYDMLVTLENNTFTSSSTDSSLIVARGGAQTADFDIKSGTYMNTAGMDVISLIEGSGAVISGGAYSSNVSAYLADGFELTRTGNGYLVIEDTNADDEGKEQADTISVVYKDVTETGTEGEKTYAIVVTANNGDVINELASVDLSLAFTEAPIANGDITFTVAPAENIASREHESTVRDEHNKRYLFNYKGIGAFEESGAEITIGTITVTGYGSFTIATADAATNVVNATTLNDNLVDSYTVAGATDNDATTGALDISGKVDGNEAVIAVPTRTLTVKVDFPNTVTDNAIAYQNMKVEITGNIDGVNKTVTYNLGTDEVAMNNGSYVFAENKLVLNEAYTVTVSGAGYRTARYTVTMTEDKTLRFWNNVMTEAQFVEIGKESSKVNVTYLAGDIVKDNNINIYDLSAVVSYFGSVSTTENGYAKYDLNRDGVIDSKDVAYVLVSWNN